MAFGPCGLWCGVCVCWACFPQMSLDLIRLVSGEFEGWLNTSDSLLRPLNPSQAVFAGSSDVLLLGFTATRRLLLTSGVDKSAEMFMEVASVKETLM